MNKRLCFAVITLLSVTCWASTPLDIKLSKQFAKFYEARELITNRFEDLDAKKMPELISREEWEKMISLPEDEKFTNADIEKLIWNERDIIRKNFNKALKHSVLDLDALRIMGEAKIGDFCRRFPKGGMNHVHPWGTLDRETAYNILMKTDPMVKPERFFEEFSDDKSEKGMLFPDELEFFRQYTIEDEFPFSELIEEDKQRYTAFFELPHDKNPFNRFMATFTVYRLSGFYDKANVELAEELMWDAFLKRSMENNISYLEVSKSVFTTYGLKDNLAGLKKIVSKAKKYGIDLRFQIGFLRMSDRIANNWKIIKKLIQYEKQFPFIVGINLQADETNHPALEKGQAIYATLMAAIKQKKSRLQTTMHAGELGYLYNVRDALILGSKRIGHGVKLRNDHVTLVWARKLKTPIEVNLSSNIMLGVVDRMENHPFLDFLRLGLPVSLSTDDEGIFRTDLSKECVLAIKHTDITYSELKKMSYYSISTSFAEGRLKNKLTRKLKVDFEKFEKNWSLFSK
ncbi:MAG: hypothetical protein KAQ98_09080 [Bacteriovoracaceae bacterium]|nr:hypothetical protein [Bacteriovoracaceae bacterium]